MIRISKLFYSPVKSLSFESIFSCSIQKNIGIVNDRLIAFSRNVNFETAKLIEKEPKSRNHHKFLSLKNTIALNKYQFSFNGKDLILKLKNKEILSIKIDDEKQHTHMCNKLIEIESSIKGPIFLLQNSSFPFFDTTHSKNIHNTISLINLNSINDLSSKINNNIEYERFRGNIYIDGIDAWEERNWINKTITINGVSFRVEMHIPRCSATNLKPETDIETINLPLAIKKKYNHSDMGVYLKALDKGVIHINDKIKIL